VSAKRRETISVLVRTRNEARHLPKLIEGLSQQASPPDEVVVVDSGSTDESVDIARAAGWKILRIDPDEFTFGRSLNFGFENCTSDRVVIISAHVYPTRSDFLEIISQRVAAAGMTIAYGRQVGDHRTKFSEKILMSTWFPSERIPDQGHAFTNNANACVPRALWEKLRYNESLTGLEDIDFSIRLLALGGTVVYEEEAEVVHVHEETYRTIQHRYRREAVAYKAIFPGERMSWLSAFRLALKNVLRDMSQAIRESLLVKVWASILLFRGAQFLGAWQGFREIGNQDTELMQRMYHPRPLSPELTRDDVPGRIEYSDND